MKRDILKNRYFFLVVRIGLLLCFILTLFIYGSYYFEIKNSILRLGQNKENLEIFGVYTSIWGTFGDFVGGTFNPIVGILSVILLFVTWRTTVETLKQTKIELEESRIIQKEMQRTQYLQQFDSFFFPFLQQLKQQETHLIELKGNNQLSELDKLYERIFGNNEYPLAEPNNELINSHIFKSYSLCLIELLRNIEIKFEDDKKIGQIYANIVKATMPMNLQQLLTLYICNSEKDLALFIKYKFFENITLKVVDKEYLSPLMISIVQSFNVDMFGNFRNLLDVFGDSNEISELEKPSSLFKNIFSKRAEMIVSGLGVFHEFVIDFDRITITFDVKDLEKEFYIIERKYQLLLCIAKRSGLSIEKSVLVKEQEIYINKIELDFNMFRIPVFGEVITLFKNHEHVKARINSEYLARKETVDEDIIFASGVDVVKKPR